MPDMTGNVRQRQSWANSWRQVALTTIIHFAPKLTKQDYIFSSIDDTYQRHRFPLTSRPTGVQQN
jgi:hypothetical protein